MKNQKGMSKLYLILLIAMAAAFAYFWSKYFAEPTATVMMQGAEQAQPAIEKAHQASDTVDRANKITEDAAKRAEENLE